MDHRQQAKDLVELASDESAPEAERFSAARKAVAIIHKYELLSDPLDNLGDNEFVQAAKTIFNAFNDPKVKKVRERVASRMRRR